MYISNVGYSTSIFQILFADIHMRHSFVYSICVASQSNILLSLSFTIQHPYFKIQYSTSLIQHCVLTIQHIYFKYYSRATFVMSSTLTFVASNAWCLCCGAECDMLAAQSATFLFGHWTFLSRLPPSVTRVYAFCGLCLVYDDLTDVYDDLTDVITLY